ncbi:MAG: ribonuclease PH [Bdellovibrionales bacterium]|nr:ribonuclease PH [Bdellovibrionales bacterium]
MRSHKRDNHSLRPIEFIPHFTKHAEGSCLIKMGDTWVLTTASIEDRVPPFLDKQGSGWVTAEYSMLPRSTHTRTRREATSGKQSGRTQEIQRLIGRSLRSCIDLKLLGERTITIDCDVLQADGGTRMASINAGFVSLVLAVKSLQKKGKLAHSPVKNAVAGISLGMKNNTVLVDLDYQEDSTCDVDMNFVFLDNKKIVEMQGTSERAPFSSEHASSMIKNAMETIDQIFQGQQKVLSE